MAKISITPVPRTGKYVPIKPVERTGKYVSINPFENEFHHDFFYFAGPFDPNDPDLYNNFWVPPPWKGFYGGETSIEIKNLITDETNISITIGNIYTGQANFNLRLSYSIGILQPQKINLATKVADDKIPLYNPNLWDQVKNVGDAIRHISFQAVDEKLIQLSSFKLTFNGKDIADMTFESGLLPKFLNITNSEPVHMDIAIEDHCLNKIFYDQNPFLRCAVNEIGSSWNTKYENCRWEWHNENPGAPFSVIKGCYKAPVWDQKFICWVLETTNPVLYKNLWSIYPYVTNYFRYRNLYISPYAEIHKCKYERKLYENYWENLGTLVKPGFLVSMPSSGSKPSHIAMFISWVDEDENPIEFNPDPKKQREPQYFLAIGGDQENKVTIKKFSICYSGCNTDIIWYRESGNGKRYCVDDVSDNPGEEGFSDPMSGFIILDYGGRAYPLPLTKIISRARLYPPGYPYVHLIPEELRYYLALLGYFDNILE